MPMATLLDSFLIDLDDLSTDGNHDEEVYNTQATILNYNDLDRVPKLQKNQHFLNTIKMVHDAMLKEPNFSFKGEEDPQYQLVIDCSTLVVDIDHEITILHNFIRDKYRAKFPELESLVLHPIDYCHVVKQIGNEMDLTLIDLKELLPSFTIMSICITASTTKGKPLSKEDLQKTIDACDHVFDFDKAKNHVLEFLESRMKYIAPNLSTIIGSTIAAKLIGIVGGLAAFIKMPSCNVQVLGAKKKNWSGFSTQFLHDTSFVFQSKIVQSFPPSLRMKACREVANKCTLAARLDYGRIDLSTQIGEAYLKEIEKKIKKWQEHPPPRQPKPLPIPSIDNKKKRGGRRLRKMKEKYALTDRQKLENRMKFGMQEESSLGDGLGRGYGMLGQVDSGILKVLMGKRKLLAKVAKKDHEKKYGNIGATSGLSSIFTFTTLQGIELINPQAQARVLENSTYFAKSNAFVKI